MSGFMVRCTALSYFEFTNVMICIIIQESLLEMVLRSCSTPSLLAATLSDSAQKHGDTLYQFNVCETAMI